MHEFVYADVILLFLAVMILFAIGHLKGDSLDGWCIINKSTASLVHWLRHYMAMLRPISAGSRICLPIFCFFAVDKHHIHFKSSAYEKEKIKNACIRLVLSD